MQFSADFIALHAHQSDVHRAERELGLQRGIDEVGSDDAGASSEPVLRRRLHRAPRLALR
ncbi:hypothetical protein ASE14_12545 [Agromyces sp. Root81]|uniref:hypothetical protein n=1 Tax=Agromyces sp. Root81 TaxID=1736601 RepID=UPI0006FD6CE0|nr:hypothetical protein [Agromyces sp. Root81]KRC61659.1 hypothetical protein ASE14_12545 [Agromyces sp. Root81]